MFLKLRNLMCILALLSATKASAQVQSEAAKLVDVAKPYRCSSDTICKTRASGANHVAKAWCKPFKASSPNGQCYFSEYSCDDKKSYTADSFDAKSKTCYHTAPKCVEGDVCNDNDVCTFDYCGPMGYCVNQADPVCIECEFDSDCDDGDEICTPEEYCIGGKCWYSGEFGCTQCASDADCDQSHTPQCISYGGISYTLNHQEVCLTNEQRCWEPYPNPIYCPLGCNDEKTGCRDDCDDQNPCTKDNYDSAQGKCVYEISTNNAECNALCDDGNLCTIDKAWATPATGGCNNTPIDCDDGEVCTTDSCVTATGKCSYVNNTEQCDDGVLCTTNNVCSGGQCGGGTQKDCNDQNPCTTDSCDTLTGGCLNVANTAACNDGNACTGNDICGNKTCSGTAVVCNDNNACTTDSCNPATGCATAPVVCVDNLDTTTDSCDPATGCKFTPIDQPACPANQVKAGAKNTTTSDITVVGKFENVDAAESAITFSAGATIAKLNSGSFYYRPPNSGNWPTLSDAQKLAMCNASGLECRNRCDQAAVVQLTSAGGAWNSCECTAGAAAK